MKKAATAKKPKAEKAEKVEKSEKSEKVASRSKAPRGKKATLAVVEPVPSPVVESGAAEVKAPPTPAPAPVAVAPATPASDAIPGGPSSAAKRAEVEAMVTGLLKHMNYPATLELKDLSDGSLGVAMHFTGEAPGVTPGKRSYLVDCMQFLVNKSVNKPTTTERRWVSLGANAFPEPRAPKPEPVQKQAQQPQGQPRAPQPQNQNAPQGQKPPQQARAAGQTPAQGQKPAQSQQQQNQNQRPREVDERSLTPAADPLITHLGTTLAQKAAKYGRVYGVMLMSPDDRARMLAAAKSVTGLTSKTEGEGHWRRVVFTADKLLPISRKQVMPDFDDEEEE